VSLYAQGSVVNNDRKIEDGGKAHPEGIGQEKQGGVFVDRPDGGRQL